MRLLWFSFLLLIAQISCGQQATVDSLQQLLLQEKTLSHAENGKIHFMLFRLLSENEEDSVAEIHLKQASTHFGKAGDVRNNCIVMMQLANNYSSNGDYLLSIETNKKIMKMAQNIRNDTILSKLYNNIGLDYKSLGNYPEALNYLLKAIAYKKKYKAGEKSLSATYLNIGLVVELAGQPDEAVKYYQTSLSLKKQIDDTEGIARVYTNLAVVEKNRKNYNLALQLLDSCEYYHNKTPDIYTEYDLLVNRANLFQIQGEKDKAFQNFEMALKIANELESNTRLGDVNQNLGSLYFKSEQYEKAIEHLKQALKYAEKTNSLTEYYEIFNNLSSALEMSGGYKEALQYRNLYIQYKDSIYNVENSIIIQEMKEKYEALEKEELIARQKIEISERERKAIENEYSIKQKEQHITLITGFAFLIIISLVLYVQQYRRVQKNARLQLGFELEKLALEFSLLQEKIQRQIPVEESNASLHELDSGKELTESDYTLPESAVDSNDTIEVIKINKYLHDPLSMREFEILNLISTGKTNRQIAEITFISENTVKYHLKNIYVKLDVKNRTEALRKASQMQAA